MNGSKWQTKKGEKMNIRKFLRKNLINLNGLYLVKGRGCWISHTLPIVFIWKRLCHPPPLPEKIVPEKLRLK